MKKTNLIRTIILAVSLVLQLSTLCFQSRGAAGDVDPSFDSGAGVNGPVSAVVMQPDGKVIIGGGFTTVKGLARPGIARLNADGSGDATFTPAGDFTNLSIAAITRQPDGKLLVCGSSRSYFPTAFAARLNTDGTTDSTFAPAPVSYPTYPSGFGSSYQSVIVQSDGKVVLGGYFTDYYIDFDGGDNYPPRAMIFRLNTNGTSDAGFAQSVGDYYTSVVSLALQSDGKLLASGLTIQLVRFNTNGTPDGNFNGVGLGAVSSMAVQSDDKVLIGGYFSTVHGTSRNGIARLNANGSLDSAFNPGTGISASVGNSDVYSIGIQSDGKVLIGGRFNLCDGTNRNHVARLNANGSFDSSFNPAISSAGSVRSLALQSAGNVVIGGDFFPFNGPARQYVARLYGAFVAPSLNIARSNAFVIVSWPTSATGYSLQESTNLPLANSWFPVAQLPATNAGQVSVTLPANVGSKFFRLKSQ